MTNLTNQIEAADENMLSSFLASLPTVSDLIEATTAVAIGGLLTLALHTLL